MQDNSTSIPGSISHFIMTDAKVTAATNEARTNAIEMGIQIVEAT